MSSRNELKGMSTVALGVLFTALAACGTSDSGTTSEGEQTTLTVWGAVQSPTGDATVEKADELFEESHPDVTIDHVVIPHEQLTSKLLASAGTQSGPDVFSYNTVVDFHALNAAGVMADITEEWESYSDRDQFPDTYVWRDFEGNVKTIFPYSDHVALYYNEDILDELNLTPPSTVAALEETLAGVAASGRYKGMAMAGAPDTGGAWQFMPLLLGEGVDYCNFGDNSQEVSEAFARVEGWVEKGYIPESTAVLSQGDAWQQFSTGDYAFGINGNWNLAAADELKFGWGTVRYPAGSEGSIVYLGGDGVAIGAFAENRDLAWEYITAARLSQQGGLINFEGNGSLPTRADTADLPEISESEPLAPFIEAMDTIHGWPNSPQSAEMQFAVAEAVSGMISGELSSTEAAQQATDDVTAAIEAGGGDC